MTPLDCFGSIDLRAWVADQRAQCERTLAGEMRADQPTKHHANGWLACLLCLEAKLDGAADQRLPGCDRCGRCDGGRCDPCRDKLTSGQEKAS